MDELKYHLSVTLFFQEKCFGLGPMMLLQGVEKTGSLQQSAVSMGMAYSKAWKIIRQLEKDWGFPLLYRHTGGTNGGGSILTPKAKILLDTYQKMSEDIDNYAEKSFKQYFDKDFYDKIKE